MPVFGVLQDFSEHEDVGEAVVASGRLLRGAVGHEHLLADAHSALGDARHRSC